jgi:hypothetical protein
LVLANVNNAPSADGKRLCLAVLSVGGEDNAIAIDAVGRSVGEYQRGG